MITSDKKDYNYITFPRQFTAYRWYKPLLVGLLTFVFFILFSVALTVIGFIISDAGDFTSFYYYYLESSEVEYTVPGMFMTLGYVAIMLPALAVAVRIIYDRPFSSYSSSRGGWKWKTFLKCLAVSGIISGAAFVIQLLMPSDGSETAGMNVAADVLVITIIMVPFQCAAEEYIFRGYIMQAVGGWTKLPVIAIIVETIVFTLGHEYNLIGLAAIFVSGLTYGIIAWKSNGLEATSASHIVNNLLAFILPVLGLAESGTDAGVLDLVISVIIDVIYLTLMLIIIRKTNWFAPKQDGNPAEEFNIKKAARQAAKNKKAVAE